MSGLHKKALQPLEGRIYGHFLENSLANVPRGIYWALEVDFAPITLFSAEWVSSLSCEWVQWPIRRWEELDGRKVHISEGSVGAETSLYLFSEHQPIKLLDLDLRHRRAEVFELRFKARLDILDPNGGVIPDFELEGRAEGRFEGIIVVCDNLEPSPGTSAAAMELLAPFADLSAYEEPRFDRFRWVVPPLVQRSAA